MFIPETSLILTTITHYGTLLDLPRAYRQCCEPRRSNVIHRCFIQALTLREKAQTVQTIRIDASGVSKWSSIKKTSLSQDSSLSRDSSTCLRWPRLDIVRIFELYCPRPGGLLGPANPWQLNVVPHNR